MHGIAGTGVIEREAKQCAGRQACAGTAERNARRPGQRAGVDQEFRRLLVGERKRIGKNETPFGIGIADLDLQPLARAIDIERPEGRARNRRVELSRKC